MSQAFNFTSRTLRQLSEGDQIIRILQAALLAVDPQEAIRHFMSSDGVHLRIADEVYSYNKYRRIKVCGIGKAGAPMAFAMEEILGKRITEGILIVKEGYANTPHALSQIEMFEAGHPIPDERSLVGAQKLINMLQDSQSDDLVIFLISGGGSALLNAPLNPISLSDLQQMTRLLLACGANIQEINTLRKHLDRVKGGRLAKLAFPATLVTLVLSDVIGDPVDVIASGPTVPDLSTFSQAWEILQKYHLISKIPNAIRMVLENGMRGDIPETPKSGEKCFAKTQNIIIGSNLIAAKAALAQAQQEGFNSLLLTTYLQGEARHVGKFLTGLACQMATSEYPVPRPGCLIVGGETTVTITGDGLGGRNQELALSTVNELANYPDTIFVTLATDGGDGPTDSAGAVVSRETLAHARALGLDPNLYLNRNDSYHFFDALDDLLRPGATQTNVNDLALIFTLPTS